MLENQEIKQWPKKTIGKYEVFDKCFLSKKKSEK